MAHTVLPSGHPCSDALAMLEAACAGPEQVVTEHVWAYVTSKGHAHNFCEGQPVTYARVLEAIEDEVRLPLGVTIGTVLCDGAVVQPAAGYSSWRGLAEQYGKDMRAALRCAAQAARARWTPAQYGGEL